MASKRVKCPACNKQFTERGLRLHFRQALSGWDTIWDPAIPHSRWAKSKGLEIPEEGYTFDNRKLNSCLDEYLSSQ